MTAKKASTARKTATRAAKPAKASTKAKAGKKAPRTAGKAKKQTQKKGPLARKVGKSTSQKNPARQEAGRKGRAAQPGRASGGRKKGTPNKTTLNLREELVALGMGKTRDHPVIFMAKIYWGDLKLKARIMGPGGKVGIVEVEASPELRIKCAAEVAQYLEAKRKAIEVTGADGGAVIVEMVKLEELEPSGVGVAKS